MLTTMKKDQIVEVFERVRTWPEKRQEDAVRVLLEMEAQDNSAYQLSDEQLAEVRRRRAQKTPKRIPAEEVFKRFRSPGA
jgi:hypothetical protein